MLVIKFRLLCHFYAVVQAYVDDACGREGTKKTHGSNLEFPERRRKER